MDSEYNFDTCEFSGVKENKEYPWEVICEKNNWKSKDDKANREICRTCKDYKLEKDIK